MFLDLSYVFITDDFVSGDCWRSKFEFNVVLNHPWMYFQYTLPNAVWFLSQETNHY